MKITLCGSIAFYGEMLLLEEKLRELGHEVKLPPREVPGPDGQPISVREYYRIRHSASADDLWVWEGKRGAMKNHFDKVTWSDAVLIVNRKKNDIEGYVGANTLLEVGLAFHLGKKIFFLEPVPDMKYCTEEIFGIRPTVIDGDLTLIS